MCEPVVVKKASVTYTASFPTSTAPVVTVTTAAPTQPKPTPTAAKPSAIALPTGFSAANLQRQAAESRRIAHDTYMDGGVRDKRAEAAAVLLSEAAYQAKRTAKQAKMDAFNGIKRR